MSHHPCPSPGRHPLDWRAGATLAALAMVMAPAAAQAQEAVRAETREAIRAETREQVVLEVDGVVLARFAEVSGLDAGARTKWADITLKRGTTDSRSLRQWHDAGRTRGAAHARKNASIVMYDTAGKPVSRWQFTNAWPSKIEVGALKAGASEALETVTITYESIQRVGP